MKREVIIALALVAITLTAYSGLQQCGFVNFDDPGYVVDNPRVTGGLSTTNCSWACKTFYEGNYLPLTWLSLMLDATLFGPGPHGFHWVNLAFHIINSLLIYLFFRQATGAAWRSAIVAAIFAVHPLRVESVVWIVERKDVLTAFFGLLTMLTYLRYTRRLKWTWYAATVLLFAATLLAKQTLSTLPCLLLLLDYWPLGRLAGGPAAVNLDEPPRRSLFQLTLEKLPLIAMAAGIITITIRAQASTHSISDLQSVPWAWRLTNAPVSYARYLGKMIWFGDLAVFYPRHPWLWPQIAGSCLLLFAITAICLWKVRSAPWLIIGWLWFLGVLAPMIGIVQFGPQAMADRFTYFSGIGVLVILAWSIPAAVWRMPVYVIGAVGMTLGLLIVFTFAQTRYWQNSLSLFTRDIDVVGSNAMAELNLGVGLYEHGDLPEAIGHLTTAVTLDPHKARAQCALAVALAKNGQLPEAFRHCRIAINCEHDNANWHLELAYLFIQNDELRAATVPCRQAIALDPRLADAHRLLGLTLCNLGENQEGVDQLKLALSIMPGWKEAQRNLKRFENSAEKSH